jgi:hypothetical protein
LLIELPIDETLFRCGVASSSLSNRREGLGKSSSESDEIDIASFENRRGDSEGLRGRRKYSLVLVLHLPPFRIGLTSQLQEIQH